MAVLSDAERIQALRGFVRRAYTEMNARADFDLVDIKAAIDACDAWIEANATSFNTALPQPFRNGATLEQKTLLFCHVALRRAGVS